MKGEQHYLATLSNACRRTHATRLINAMGDQTIPKINRVSPDLNNPEVVPEGWTRRHEIWMILERTCAMSYAPIRVSWMSRPAPDSDSRLAGRRGFVPPHNRGWINATDLRFYVPISKAKLGIDWDISPISEEIAFGYLL